MKKNDLISPAHALVAAILVGITLSFAVIHIATGRPWLGLKLSYDSSLGGAVVVFSQGPSAHIPKGTVLTGLRSGADEMAFSDRDLIAEPDGSMGTYKTYNEFLDRQDRLARIQDSGEIFFQDSHGAEWKIHPLAERPFWSLPIDFWVQFIVGLSAWLISASVWALRPREIASRYLLLNGFGMLISAQLAAPYTTRELAIPSRLFWWIDGLNFFGGSLFIASLVALLLYYPRALAPRWVGRAVIAVYIAWYILQDNGFFESMTDARRQLVMVGIAASFVLAGIHWFKTRKDPLARASLQWFLLSWLLAIGMFSSVLFIPQLFGVDTSSMQGYAFMLFLLMYVGLSFGILRFRLFGLGEWWYRIIFWVLAMLLLMVLDLVFLFGLNLSNRVSLSAALLICGVFWFPLRSLLQSRLMPRTVSWTATFKRVVNIALAPRGEERNRMYISLLKDSFNPLNIQMTSDSPDDIEILDHGQILSIPSIVGLAALRLEYAQGGQKLFSPKDVSSVKELAEMLRHTADSQNAYKKGVIEERHRIAQDLHDDVGARLLSGLHSSESSLRTTIQEAIGDIRSIVSGISGEMVPFFHFLADVRHESLNRCQMAKIELKWPIQEFGSADAHPLDYRIYKALGSSIREVISNVIKHANAGKLEVDITPSKKGVTFRFMDDGDGIPQSVLDGGSQGHGLKILKRRFSELGGQVDLRRREPGTEISFFVPWSASHHSQSELD